MRIATKDQTPPSLRCLGLENINLRRTFRRPGHTHTQHIRMFDIMLLSYPLAVRVRVRINQALATALSLARPNRGRGSLSVSLAEASSFEERAGAGRGDGGIPLSYPNRGPIPFTGRSINEIRKYAVRKFPFLIKKGFCHMTIRFGNSLS